MSLSRRLIPLALLLWVFAFALAAPSQDAATSIKNETERLQKSLKEKPASNSDFAEAGDAAKAALQAAAQASAAGDFYSSLESLGRAADLLGGIRVMVDQASLVKQGLPAFEAAWGAASQRLAALDKKAHERTWGAAAVAVRALSEAAQGKAIPLLDGARGFAISKGPAEGLFYMGQAEGEAEFAGFCAALNLPAAKAKFPLRSYLPELQALQAKANAAFQPPRSIDLHPRFIALNSTIKLAEELDSTRFHAGALYQYLEAIRHYGMLEAPPLDDANQSRLKEDLAATQKKLSASTNDDSIAELFLQRAWSQTSHADGTAPTADEWRSARVILDQVLPAYAAARQPASPLQKASGKTVEITLVRWPYT
ncbi:MAG TPA: hypothetical protein VFW45_03285 [Candidatus Polarisedimenticolia bacterium]|nr:hypothetical protein [Candidatus Polarisedimenticolia bacterium]